MSGKRDELLLISDMIDAVDLIIANELPDLLVALRATQSSLPREPFDE